MKRGLAWLVGGVMVFAAAVVRAAVEIEAPFTETGQQIWEVVIPVTIAILSAFGLWVAIRAGHIGIFLGIVMTLLIIFFTGAIPDLITEAGLNWPF